MTILGRPKSVLHSMRPRKQGRVRFVRRTGRFDLHLRIGARIWKAARLAAFYHRRAHEKRSERTRSRCFAGSGLGQLRDRSLPALRLSRRALKTDQEKLLNAGFQRFPADIALNRSLAGLGLGKQALRKTNGFWSAKTRRSRDDTSCSEGGNSGVRRRT